MICVSIGRSRHKHMLAEHRHLAEQGARLVELRLDYISTRVNLQRLLVDRPTPVIATYRREADGGKFAGSEEQRMMMIREAIASGVDYIDLEDDIARNVPRYGATKRIVSHHNFHNTPDDIGELHAKMAAMDADVVKIATMANRPSDNVRMLELVKSADVPTVGMCMGDIGTPSRILGARFGAPFTYATFHHERTLAPGQLSFQQMTDIYGYEAIGPDTDVYGVIADPVGHSLSPVIHNAAFRELGLNAVYVPFRVPSDALAEFMSDAPRLGLKGLSVTMPHKEAIAAHLTKVDPAAEGIAAVNTVVPRGDEVVGYNTDCHAAMRRVGAGPPRARHTAHPGRGQPAGGQAGPAARRRGRRSGGDLRAHQAGRERRSSPAARRTAPKSSPRSSAPARSSGRDGTTRRPTSSSTARRSACTRTSTSRRSTRAT